MFSFKNDYSEGCHPNILKALGADNLEQASGYGLDRFCEQATRKIQTALLDETVDIHFVSGGTQANLLAISAFLRPYEGVISVDSGHIVFHETGAIEATGHKIITTPGKDGKLSPSDLDGVMSTYTNEHSIHPKLVYISNSTEIGTIYSKEDLRLLYETCQKHHLYLYADGARIGSAVTAGNHLITLADMNRYTDAFFIGGTKNGALLGEALVIRNDTLKPYMRYQMKQRGALLAKSRLLGIQFDTLFTDDLFYEIAKHANQQADRIRDAFTALDYAYLVPTDSNQIFPILPYGLIEHLQTEFDFYVWSQVDEDHAAIRLITSFATPDTAVDALIAALHHYHD